MGFFGILLTIVVSLWLLGRLLPYLLAWLIARQGRRMFGGAAGSRGAGGAGGGARGGAGNSRKEGEITVESAGSESEVKISKAVGDYVEYEEEA